jgi:hypothetical protein
MASPCRESEQLANTLFGQAEQTVVTGQDSGLPRLLAVPSGVELRQLEAFVAVATELHFGQGRTVRLGITPPVAPVLAPHLISRFAPGAPQVTVDVQRMWLPALADALTSGRVDVVITCGLIPAPTASRTRCSARNRS